MLDVAKLGNCQWGSDSSQQCQGELQAVVQMELQFWRQVGAEKGARAERPMR